MQTTSQASFLSYQAGPSIGVAVGCWRQFYFPTVIGTVSVIVNQSTTIITTVYHTNRTSTDVATSLGRTDTNSDGTVTGAWSGGAIVTYPTGDRRLFPSFTWEAFLPTSHAIGSSTDRVGCCALQQTSSPTLPHPPFPPQTQTVDPTDPSGLNYILGDCDYAPPAVWEVTRLKYNPDVVTSLWGNQSITLSYAGCPYTDCGFPSSRPVASRALPSTVLSILTTVTTTLQSLGSEPEATQTASIDQPKVTGPLPVVEPSTSTTPSETRGQAQPDRGSNLPATEALSPVASTIVTPQPQLPPTSADTIGQPSSNSPIATPPGGAATPSPIAASSLQNTPIAPPPLTFGSTVITAVSSQYVIGTATLTPGGVVTASGTVLSYPTINLPPITIGADVVSPTGSQYVFASQTLSPGAQVVVSGTTITFAPGATQLVVGTSTAILTDGVGGYVWTGISSGTPTSVGIPPTYTGSAERRISLPSRQLRLNILHDWIRSLISCI